MAFQLHDFPSDHEGSFGKLREEMVKSLALARENEGHAKNIRALAKFFGAQLVAVETERVARAKSHAERALKVAQAVAVEVKEVAAVVAPVTAGAIVQAATVAAVAAATAKGGPAAGAAAAAVIDAVKDAVAESQKEPVK